jgi:hypothetical protein
MHAADAMRLLAATAVPLHVLPFAGMLFAILSFNLPWLLFFLAWTAAQVVLHLLVIRSADHLLEETRRSLLHGLAAGTVLIAFTIASQVIMAGLLGLGFFLIALLMCGLFDMLAVGALFYSYWATYRAAFGRLPVEQDRHTGFEIVLPEAQPLDIQHVDRLGPADP